MNKTYDLIIVGAGPAGTSAALYARQHGLSALLLEKESFPRDKICGDAISGKSMTILQELGLLDEVQKLPGALIESILFGSPASYFTQIGLMGDKRKGVPSGLVIRREIFDTFLFNKASETCDTLQNFKVRDIEIDDDSVKVSGVDSSGGNRAFSGRIAIGADGFNSIIARKMGLYRHEPEHWVVALRQYWRNVEMTGDCIEIHYTKTTQPGYFWIFPLENGMANVGVGMLHKTIKEKNIDLKDVLKQTINSQDFAARFKNAEKLEEPRGWNLPVGSTHRINHGKRFMLLGDAAGLIDPFTGEGIGNALFSAKYAVETAAAAIKQNDFSMAKLAVYDKLIWDRLGNELSVSTRLQKVGRIKLLLDFVIGKAQRNPEVRDIISGMMSNAIPKKQLANPLFYLKLLFT